MADEEMEDVIEKKRKETDADTDGGARKKKKNEEEKEKKMKRKLGYRRKATLLRKLVEYENNHNSDVVCFVMKRAQADKTTSATLAYVSPRLDRTNVPWLAWKLGITNLEKALAKSDKKALEHRAPPQSDEEGDEEEDEEAEDEEKKRKEKEMKTRRGSFRKATLLRKLVKYEKQNDSDVVCLVSKRVATPHRRTAVRVEKGTERSATLAYVSPRLGRKDRKEVEWLAQALGVLNAEKVIAKSDEKALKPRAPPKKKKSCVAVSPKE